MLYSFLIYSAEGIHGRLSPEEQELALEQHRLLQKKLDERGDFATAKLMPVSNAVTLKSKTDQGHKTLITDGPFADTKEQFVGFYLADFPNLDEAIAMADMISTPYHSIEVRPVSWSGGTLSSFQDG
ncbi:YciI family protein [Kiloniella sp. EL199]|uniref:YciI family protein n=1 Tax=Kiloniella sp. EL199 TaxID=2107581 RepID=UPI000EA0F9C4|nr:YciI family protein [Kiloniella sp. EL199]